MKALELRRKKSGLLPLTIAESSAQFLLRRIPSLGPWSYMSIHLQICHKSISTKPAVHMCSDWYLLGHCAHIINMHSAHVFQNGCVETSQRSIYHICSVSQIARLSLYTIVSIHHTQPGSSMQCQILSPNYEAIQGHALREKAIVCTPASEISSSTGSYCIRRAAVTTSAKASAPDADAGSIFDMRASLAATKL